MSKTVLSAILLVGGLMAFGDDYGDRAKLAGQWTLETGNTPDQGSTWIIENKGDSVRITTSKGEQQVAEFECNTVGKECDAKDNGKPVKVSFYFNGPKLVQMETRGSEVVKKRLGLSDDGNVMQLEVIPLVPSGKTETLHFKRAAVAVAGK